MPRVLEDVLGRAGFDDAAGADRSVGWRVSLLVPEV
jgi:hypothetical protein